jgi:hypothetical protein
LSFVRRYVLTYGGPCGSDGMCVCVCVCVWLVCVQQESKWKEAIRYYDPIVKKNNEHILNVPAIVLANLCVACIMTSQNEQAEELMRKIEKEVSQSVRQAGRQAAGRGPCLPCPVDGWASP